MLQLYLLLFKQIIDDSVFSKLAGIDEITDLSLNIRSNFMDSIPLNFADKLNFDKMFDMIYFIINIKDEEYVEYSPL